MNRTTITVFSLLNIFSTLTDTLRTMDLSVLLPFLPGQPKNFANFLDKALGVQWIFLLNWTMYGQVQSLALNNSSCWGDLKGDTVSELEYQFMIIFFLFFLWKAFNTCNIVIMDNSNVLLCIAFQFIVFSNAKNCK